MKLFIPEILLFEDCTLKVNETQIYGSITQETIKDFIFFELLSYSPYDAEKILIEDSVLQTQVTIPKETFADNFNYQYRIVKDGSYNFIKFILPLTINETLYWDNGIYKNGIKVPLTLELIKEIENTVIVPFFSTVIINQCLIKQQEALLPIYGNCMPKEDKLKRDFLLDAIYVLHYLLYIDNQLEAQKLIERLQSCNSICEIKSSCNCG